MEHESEWFERFKGFYRNQLNRAIDHPWKVIGFCALFVISSFFVYGAFGKGAVFFPISEPKVVAVEVTGPLGVDLATTEKALETVEKKLFSIPADKGHVESFSTVVGLGKPAMGSGDIQPESHKGYIDVSFVDYEDRRVSSWTAMQWMQENIPPVLPGWKISIKKQEDGPSTGYPVNFELIGEDFAALSALSDSVKSRLAQIPELINIDDDYEPVRPEISIKVDRDRAQQLGVSTSEVALAVRGAIQGFEAGKFRIGKEEHDIMVRLAPEARESFAGLHQITVPSPSGPIPLSSVASLQQQASLASIRHLDGKRTIQVWAELAPGTMDETQPKAAALAAIADLTVPAGYTLQTGSANRDQEETQAFLGLAFLIAIALVVFTMVAQFNSISQPLMVFVGILLSVGGVFYGLTFMRVTFSIMMSGIGIIALAGVVAKNGIVLIDFINHLRNEGKPLREAVIEGGVTRIRPVLLTAIAAMIALVPMATGKGFDFTHFTFILKSESGLWWAPLAWAIFWGLFFNTILTLIAVPTLYYAWEGRKEKRRARKLAKQGLA